MATVAAINKPAPIAPLPAAVAIAVPVAVAPDFTAAAIIILAKAAAFIAIRPIFFVTAKALAVTLFKPAIIAAPVITPDFDIAPINPTVIEHVAVARPVKTGGVGHHIGIARLLICARLKPAAILTHLGIAVVTLSRWFNPLLLLRRLCLILLVSALLRVFTNAITLFDGINIVCCLRQRAG